MAKSIGEVELKALIAREISLAKTDRAQLSKKQVQALEYYQGEMKDVPAEEGRSRAVSRDLADVMGWVLPGIIRVFTASEHMAIAEPVGPEDMEGAAQATDGLNYVFWKENDGYRVVYNATWDSLLGGNGVVKTWHDDTPDEKITTHTGLSDDEYYMLANPDDPNTKVEVLAYSGPMSEKNPTKDGTHSVKIKRITTGGCTRVMAIPPENYGKDSDSKTCETARFQYHKEEKSRSELIEMGFDRTKVMALGRSSDNEESEEVAREMGQTSDDGDPSTELVDLYECYVKVDVDGDDVSETCRVFYAGNKDGGEILDWEEWEDETPFDDIPCQPMPHKWEAGSLADETIDVQRIKTALLRQALDNTYATNNPQRFVKGKITNPDELFSPSFGGAIFGDANAEVTNLTVPFVANHAYDAINYQDQVIERRTGVSRTTMALDPDALQNQTATANQNAKDAAYSQIELIARNQAELGWKKVFRKILKLEIKHQNKPRMVRMRGKFVQIDPRVWNADMDVSINVGLGTGSRDRDMAMLQTVLGNQVMLSDRLAMMSPAKALEMLPYVMTTLNKSAEAAGIRSPELFYPEVKAEDIEQGKQHLEQMAQQPSPEIQLEKAKGETQKEIAAFETQAKTQLEQVQMQREVEKERAQMEADLQVKMAELQKSQLIEDQKMQFEAQKLAVEARQKELDRQQQMQIEMMKLNAQAQAQNEQRQFDEKTRKDEGKTRTNELLIANGKEPLLDGPAPDQIMESLGQLSEVLQRVLAASSAPKRIVRDPNTGKALGVETMVN